MVTEWHREPTRAGANAEIRSGSRLRLAAALLRSPAEAARRRVGAPAVGRSGVAHGGTTRARDRVWHRQSSRPDQAAASRRRCRRTRPGPEGAGARAAESGPRGGTGPARSGILRRLAV